LSFRRECELPNAHPQLIIARLRARRVKNAIIYSNTGNFELRLTANEPRVFGVRVN
jgi:hypothetical protein